MRRPPWQERTPGPDVADHLDLVRAPHLLPSGWACDIEQFNYSSASPLVWHHAATAGALLPTRGNPHRMMRAVGTRQSVDTQLTPYGRPLPFNAM
jgi:hypothetical protein